MQYFLRDLAYILTNIKSYRGENITSLVNVVPLKLLAVACPSLLDHMNKVVRQNERYTLPVDPKFPLEVAQEMPKVNVEQLRDKG